ncbi:hypothetical protein E2C01_092146 [Portunus trituberculatus]|uniref:Uncharacterized protein n=1 Tax=Portunus trituberculatus TaxID=210409 RepID=A0A5B7JUP6_PORTR|nr:hypothetical protein [Portunus trituberculatus]
MKKKEDQQKKQEQEQEEEKERKQTGRQAGREAGRQAAKKEGNSREPRHHRQQHQWRGSLQTGNPGNKDPASITLG